MELKAGMYVRTKNGKIKKLLKYTIDENVDYINNHRLYFEGDDFDGFGSLYKKEELPKGSYRIIDLIEVGDYVNGYKVLIKSSECERPILVYGINTNDKQIAITIYEEDIKTIVTKEQFESMKYSLEG